MTNTTENIILIGMPGAGKSTLGVVLAKILGYEFIDADLLIQGKLDKTLQKIIDACGPDGFIEVENEVLCTLSTSHAIIATGGSAVYSDEAMKHLSSIGTVVYLQVSYEELENRLGGLHERGVVMKNGIGMSLVDLYEERVPPVRKVRRSYYRHQRPFGSRCGTKARRSNLYAVKFGAGHKPALFCFIGFCSRLVGYGDCLSGRLCIAEDFRFLASRLTCRQINRRPRPGFCESVPLFRSGTGSLSGGA